MYQILTKTIIETIQISLLVLIMMIFVDFVNVWTRGKIETFLKKGGKWQQYITASFIGVMPGCIGGFVNVSLYIHGLISFGALAGAMIAVSGDEAFVMLAMFPKQAIILFVILFVIGILGGRIIDLIIKKFKIPTCENCEHMVIHLENKGFKHYLKEHIYKHIIKKHIWKTVLWTFFALTAVEIALKYLNLQELTLQYKVVILLIGASVGLIPESGPHLIFVTMFAKGLIPFSVLLTSSIVQDGHGLLPMLAYSIKDLMLIKIFNFFFGLIIGLVLLAAGF